MFANRLFTDGSRVFFFQFLIRAGLLHHPAVPVRDTRTVRDRHWAKDHATGQEDASPGRAPRGRLPSVTYQGDRDTDAATAHTNAIRAGGPEDLRTWATASPGQRLRFALLEFGLGDHTTITQVG